MKSFLEWWKDRDTGAFDTPLFIAHKEEGVGLIIAAVIKYSKTTGRKYIALTIQFSENDVIESTLSRLSYTSYVLRNGLGTDLSDEEHNVALIVGGSALVRFDRVHHINGQAYTEAYVKDILR